MALRMRDNVCEGPRTVLSTKSSGCHFIYRRRMWKGAWVKPWEASVQRWWGRSPEQGFPLHIIYISILSGITDQISTPMNVVGVNSSSVIFFFFLGPIKSLSSKRTSVVLTCAKKKKKQKKLFKGPVVKLGLSVTIP